MNATLTPGTYQGKTAEQWRAEGRRSVQAERESFERCDTDGFMSQWAHQIGALENQYKAELAERGAWMEIPALFDLDGNLVDSLHGWGQYSEYYMILDADGNKDITKGRKGYFSPSQARNETTARRNNAAKGFYVGTVKVPAVVDIRGGSITSVNAGIFPAERTVTSANVIEIVDNGHETPEPEAAPAEQPQTTEQETQMPETTPQTETAPAELTVDIPGVFTEWFEGSGVMQDTDDKLDDASRALRQAYADATPVRRGRAVTLRLSTTDPEALWVLGEYAETVIQGGSAMDFTASEVRAARIVIERAEKALQPVYEARFPQGAKAVITGLDAVLTVEYVRVDLPYGRVMVGLTAANGTFHVVEDKQVTLQPAEA